MKSRQTTPRVRILARLISVGFVLVLSVPHLRAVIGQENTDDSSKKHQHTNKLAGETSPYLLMHAHNPVNWYPWGEEALEKAKKENKVIFLSIGYSSCHWCHVMERESFVDAEIAAYMNEHYVCIKIDREERPDIDSIYMTSLHVYNQLSGSGRGGGWPLSMFLTPDGKPFFGGTYFPARDGDRGATTGFFTILKKVSEFWKASPAQIIKDADTITNVTKQELAGALPSANATIDAGWVTSGLRQMKTRFDEEYGGFTDLLSPERPKFPEPSNLMFLIDELNKHPDNADAKNMLVGTLDKMAMGGIWDHLGGGFHRYSVDRYWRIPHFEKMLYDNGQLATVYAEAYQLTGREDYRQIVVKLCDFVLAEMTSAEGGFYSALDADSEDEEGKFYRWTRAEIKALLTDDEYALFAKTYGIDAKPNFEGEFYAPQFAKPFPQVAKSQETKPEDLEAALVPIRTKLMTARGKRARPLTDTKILTSWNGLMIRGLADAGRILKEKKYVDAAEKAADFILSKMSDKEGKLFRTYGQGEAKLNAYLDDYAFMIDGLIALHIATGDKKWLEQADRLQQLQNKLFTDEKNGGFFFTSNDHEELLARGKDPVDGAEPSGNSVSAQNLVYLAKALDNPDYRDRAKLTVLSASALIARAPTAAPRLLIAVRELTQ